MVGLRVLLLWDVLCEVGRRMKAPAKAIAHRSMAKRRRTWGKLAIAKYWENRAELRDHETSEVDSCKSIWAVLKRSFISQGRKELLALPLTHHLRRHSASLRVEIPVFCLRASRRWLTHLRVLLTRAFLWPPPFLPHERRFIAWFIWGKTRQNTKQNAWSPAVSKVKDSCEWGEPWKRRQQRLQARTSCAKARLQKNHKQQKDGMHGFTSQNW